ncbi:MAG: hypothetical protein A2521_02275 [Deltaproteobacteria bacterium RIFOXYD12_FULL_57_12]|nr:MAG: hypothetical protein A2521_02275 [Deltaproteobacteria bacterium RIFOXYD12_FULL_57_12]
MDKRQLDDLRKKAEERIDSEISSSRKDSDTELRRVVHELRTHQIELEVQNEELRQVQQELVDTRDRYVDLYDFAPVGYLTVSDTNLIVEVNLTLADLLGAARNTLFDQPFSNFIVPEDQDICYKHFRELIDLKSRKVCELRIRRKDGNWFWARLECVPMAQNDTNGIRVRIALQDITETKRLEAEILNVEKLEATAQLAGGIAHDFNNLLAVIMGNIELAEKDMSSGLSVSERLRIAKDACLSAADLAKKFLTFSSGGGPVKKISSLEALLADAASLSLAGSNVKPEYSLPAGLWPVEVDAGQMILAVGNVLTNAKEAMPQGGVVRIGAENVEPVSGKIRKIPAGRDARYIRVSITDQGGSIPEDILTRVFDPYFSTKQPGPKKGLGLGLTIAHSIIKKHGGSIDVASRPDSGTTLTICLPASDKPVVTHDEKPRLSLLANTKILVMDDERMLRELAGRMLEGAGYEVETAGDGEEAIQKFKQAQQAGLPFGAVILDLTIKGGLGGAETIKRLKKLDPGVRAIVASGYANDPVMLQYREHGFLDALQKPYREKDFKKSLGKIVAGVEP